MIAKLVANKLRGRTVIALGASFNYRDALLVVHDMQRRALQCHGRASGAKLTIDLEPGQIEALFGACGRHAARLPLCDFTNALPRCVIDIPSGLRGAAVDDLPCSSL